MVVNEDLSFSNPFGLSQTIMTNGFIYIFQISFLDEPRVSYFDLLNSVFKKDNIDCKWYLMVLSDEG